MSIPFRHCLLTTLLAGLLCSAPAQAEFQDELPEIGTTAAGTLTIDQEKVMGDYYVREFRGKIPLIYDPLLTEYLSELGGRLVNKAESVRTPFHFYLVNNDEINAFAFFGGNVVLHSGLFRVSDNESQFASVMAHEISHVTQRHLARFMEDQQRTAPIAWAGTLGSILLTMANPQLGMAALTTTMAGAQQNAITFTQSNEKEADRIGMRILSSAGFDPQGMPDFMQKLTDQLRYSTKPPEILLTHPLPESRLADARNRANQLPKKVIQSSESYLFAKVRTLGMYSNIDKKGLSEYLNSLAKGSKREQNAAQYGKAVLAYEAKNYAEAKQLLQDLLSSDKNNLWYLDLMTDVDLAQSKPAEAITRLEAALPQQPKNPVLQLNLANAYLEGHRPQQASRLLYRYTYDHPNDVNGWELLSKAYANEGKRDEELAARAEKVALMGQLDEAISLLSTASRQAATGSLNQARYDARIDQLRSLQKSFAQFK